MATGCSTEQSQCPPTPSLFVLDGDDVQLSTMTLEPLIQLISNLLLHALLSDTPNGICTFQAFNIP